MHEILAINGGTEKRGQEMEMKSQREGEREREKKRKDDVLWNWEIWKINQSTNTYRGTKANLAIVIFFQS